MLVAAQKKTPVTLLNSHPTVKMLALIVSIADWCGLLFAEGLHTHVPKVDYRSYFAIFFSLVVEMLNLRMRKKTKTTSEIEKTF